MPRGDRTGPAGTGPMTGRGVGFCSGFSVPGFMNGIGRRMGRAMGWGRGWGFGRVMGRWGYGVAPYHMGPNAPAASLWDSRISPVQEREILQSQAGALGEELKRIQQRISEMEAESNSGKK